MFMSPLEIYKRDIDSPFFTYDPLQERVIHHAEALYHALRVANDKPAGFWLDLAEKVGWRSKSVIKGLYIWGGVGRGKTYILDMLSESLLQVPFRRVHFHQFMQTIHQQLYSLNRQANPLELIAAQWATEIKVLLVDEFHVQDIADAMLLAGLLESFFRRGIVLVTTSNIPPDELYREGLQRDKFLPAIKQIKSHTLSVELRSGADYRLQKEGLLNGKMEDIIQAVIKTANIECSAYERKLAINNRLILTRAANNELVWFDFDEICNTPRSTSDYLKIAEIFTKVVVTDVPVFNEADDNAALRFIHMIDTWYDYGIELYYTAAAMPADLYQGQLHEFAFRRTSSRLVELAGLAFKRHESKKKTIAS